MKIVRIIGGVVLVGALIAGLVLVSKNQETRKGAFFAKVGVSVLPDSKEIRVGESLTAKVKVNAGSQKVSGVNFKINYDSNVIEVVSVEMNKTAFNTISKQEAAGGVIGLIGLSTKTSGELATGVFDVATLVLKGKRDGTVNLNFASDYEIAGFNPTGGEDKQLEASFNGASYKVGSGGGPITVGPSPTSGTVDGVDFYLTPASGNVSTNGGLTVEARLKTGGAGIAGVNMKIKFDSSKLTVSNLTKGELFDSAPVMTVNTDQELISLSLLSMKASSQLPRGDIKLVTFRINGKTSGVANISLGSGYEVVGRRADGSSGVINLRKIDGGSYAVGSGTTVVITPTLAITPTPKYFAMADYEFRPATGTIAVGDKTKVAMWLKSGTTKISGATLRVIYDKTKVKVSNLVASSDWNAPVATVNESTGEIKLAVISMKPSSQLPSGEIKIAEFEITGTTTGTAEFKLADDYEITGYNPSGGSPLVRLLRIGKGNYTVGARTTVVLTPTVPAARCKVENGVVKVTPVGGAGTCHDIQEAVDVSGDGGVVELSKGVFELKRAVEIQKSLNVRGYGTETRVVLKTSSPNSIMFGLHARDDSLRLSGVPRLVFQGFAIEAINTSVFNVSGVSVKITNLDITMYQNEDARNNISAFHYAGAGVNTGKEILIKIEGTNIKQGYDQSNKYNVYGISVNGDRGLGLDRCQIVKNLVEFNGNGFWLGNGGSCLVEGNNFKSYGTESAVVVSANSSGDIRNNLFRRNIPDGMLEISIEQRVLNGESVPDGVVIENNVFRSEAGGVEVKYGKAQISGNVFEGYVRLGVDIGSEVASTVVKNNTFVASSDSSLGDSTAVVVNPTGNKAIKIVNNIIVQSRAGVVGNALVVLNNDVWNNYQNYRTVESIFGVGKSPEDYKNISLDPKFGIDYCLMPGSPAIGTGENGTDMGARGKCGGVSPTVTPQVTVVPTGVMACKECPAGTKVKGDANCDGVIDYSDFSIWRKEYFDLGGKGQVAKDDWQANFDCKETGDKKVSLLDFTKWLNVCLGVGGKCRL